MTTTATEVLAIERERHAERHDYVNAVLRVAMQMSGRAGWAESVEFVNEVGNIGMMQLKSEEQWPLSGVATIAGLVELAQELRLIRRLPRKGDVFLQWSPVKKRFVKAGFIVSVADLRQYPNGREYYPCVSIEGEVGKYGLPGARTFMVHRRMSPGSGDRVIRWTAAFVEDGED